MIFSTYLITGILIIGDDFYMVKIKSLNWFAISKGIVSIVIIVFTSFIMLTVGYISASATSKTQAEGVAWANNAAATKWNVDVDGAAGVQCVDLIKGYYKYLGVSAVKEMQQIIRQILFLPGGKESTAIRNRAIL